MSRRTIDVLYAMARHVGIPCIVQRDRKWEQMAIDSGLPAISIVWDGSKLVVQSPDENTLSHEIGHWIEAGEANRAKINFGMKDDENKIEREARAGEIGEGLLKIAWGLADT